MKKFLIGFLMLFVFAVTVPLEANAQTCRPRKKAAVNRNYFNGNSYNTQNRNYRRGNFFQRHRKVRNIALAKSGGASIGGLIGEGRTNMLKGAIIGAGTGAFYTYVLRPKKKYR